MAKQDVVLSGDLPKGALRTFTRGEKLFELSNHLGNVLATVSDRRVQVGSGSTLSSYTADVVSAQDYYPFGMLQLGRTFNASGYRYGFNGKENDNEVKGERNSLDFGNRTYDPRVGRFLSIDKMANLQPFTSPYGFAGNRPIWAIDANGDIEVIVNYIHHDHTGKEVSRKAYTYNITTQEDLKGIVRTPVQIDVHSKDVLVEVNPSYKYWTVKRTAVEIVPNTGETFGENLKRTDPIQYYAMKVVINNPTGIGKLVMAGGKKRSFYRRVYVCKC